MFLVIPVQITVKTDRVWKKLNGPIPKKLNSALAQTFLLQAPSSLPSFLLSSFPPSLPFKMSAAVMDVTVAASMLNAMDAELFRAMESGELLWGDLLMDYVAPEPPCEVIPYSYEDDMMDGWDVPDLTLRKGIWENFPVTLLPIVSRDGTERYAVVWHRKNLTEWRQTRPNSIDEFMEYKEYCEWRLMYALKQYAHKYTVEPARSTGEICVLAMVHAPKVAEADAETESETSDNEDAFVTLVPAAAAPVVAVRRALDVLKSFPVSWDREGKNHYIKIHNKNIQILATSKGKSVTAMTSSVHADLLDALAECSDCVVTAKPGYLCAVLMN